MPQAWGFIFAMRAGAIVQNGNYLEAVDQPDSDSHVSTWGLGFVALRVGQPNECNLNEFVLRVYPDEPVSLKVHKPLKSPVTYWD